MGMYTGDKTEPIKVRLNPDQLRFIDDMAETCGYNRSEVIRIIIDSYRNRRNEPKLLAELSALLKKYEV